MRCIYCSNNANYKARARGRCPKCGRLFAFEPKQGDPISDPRMKKAIEHVSAGGQLRFTERQLYYALAKPRTARVGGLIATLVVAGFVAMGITGWLWALFVAGGASVLVAIYGLRQPSVARKLAFPMNQMPGLMAKWRAAHGAVAGLLEPADEDSTPTPTPAEDLHAYSFDFVVVTDRDESARMLVANGLHMSGIAVMRIESYPRGFRDDLIRMVARNERATVVLLHDATARGVALASEVRATKWFADRLIVDLGLRPNQVRQMTLPRMTVTTPVDLTRLDRVLGFGDVTPDEAEWLQAGNGVELAAVTPARLLNVVRGAVGSLKKQREAALLSGAGAAATGVVALAGAGIVADVWAEEEAARRARNNDSLEFEGDG